MFIWTIIKMYIYACLYKCSYESNCWGTQFCCFRRHWSFFGVPLTFWKYFRNQKLLHPPQLVFWPNGVSQKYQWITFFWDHIDIAIFQNFSKKYKCSNGPVWSCIAPYRDGILRKPRACSRKKFGRLWKVLWKFLQIGGLNLTSGE